MVNTREIATEYRLSHWAQVMQERTGSGMSIRSYCKSIGLHENVYYYWQRKLREATVLAKQSETGAVILKQSEPKPGKAPQGLVVPPKRNCSPLPPGWAICEARQEAQNPQSCIHIEIGKSRIAVDASTDYELLANVCRTLMTLC